MYRASDQVRNEPWLDELDGAAEELELDAATRTRARDLFLSTAPEEARSKRAAIAASLYVATLIAGEERSQGSVAEAVGVARHTVQQRWKALLETADFDVPSW